jgi:hypothetical protein
MKKALSISLMVLIMVGLSSSITYNSKKDNLMAIWVYKSYKDGIMSFVSSKKFKRKKPGIEFKNTEQIVKRQNVSWCGTAPIKYGNFNGTYEFTSDSTLTIKYDFWEKKSEQDWQIIKLTDKRLIIKIVARR